LKSLVVHIGESADEKKVTGLIEDIDDLMQIHCDQIAHEHHKHCDGVWSIEIDLFLKRLTVSHQGYLWDYSVSRHPRNIISALERFRDALDKQIKSHKGGDSRG